MLKRLVKPMAAKLRHQLRQPHTYPLVFIILVVVGLAAFNLNLHNRVAKLERMIVTSY